MRVRLEHGDGFVTAELPEDADVFIAGETVPDPPHLPLDEIEAATRAAIQTPMGMPTLGEVAHPGARAVIVFPDKVKGGAQPTAHRKVAIPLVIEELISAGVHRENISLICSNGLHRKNTPDEIRTLLGDQLYDDFADMITNHDSEDVDNLVDLGVDPQGNPVIMNRTVFEADIPILIGHTLGNPYGGYSGGYKHAATGITHWRSIASHHNPEVMHGADFTPVSHHSVMRGKFDSIGRHMEARMGHPFFCVDAVLDTRMNQIAVFAGRADAIQPLCWEVADRRTYVHWAEKTYDVLIFGLPRSFQYGAGMGTNPLLIMQAISAQVIRHKRVLSDRVVIIAASVCDGDFHATEFPSYRETYELFRSADRLADVSAHAEGFAQRPEYVAAYRDDYAYHPFHAFSMTACADIAEEQCAAIYVVGAEQPGFARAMGMKTRGTVEEALDDARRRFLPENPAILALPEAFTRAGVHLCPATSGVR